MNENNYCIITTTIDNEIRAREIATSLLEQRLVACVQLHPIESLYHWNSAIEESRELLLQMKTRSIHFEAVREQILKLHSYDIAEIIMTPIIDANESYLEWIEKETL